MFDQQYIESQHVQIYCAKSNSVGVCFICYVWYQLNFCNSIRLVNIYIFAYKDIFINLAHVYSHDQKRPLSKSDILAQLKRYYLFPKPKIRTARSSNKNVYKITFFAWGRYGKSKLK